MEQDSTKYHHATYEFFVSGIFHLIFWATETSESKINDKGYLVDWI
jgi:hypothetical protein